MVEGNQKDTIPVDPPPIVLNQATHSPRLKFGPFEEKEP